MDSQFFIIQQSVLPLISQIGSAVGALAAIAALFYVGSKVWEPIARNEPIDVYPLLRPFVIIILCLNFTLFVVTPIEGLLRPISEATIGLCVSTKEKAFADMQSALTSYQDKLKAEKEKNGEGSWFSSIKEKVAEALEKFTAWIMKGIMDIFSFIRTAIAYIFRLMRMLLLAIIQLIGPIALALSLFPGFTGNLTAYLSKYISIYMWLPICYTIDAILTLVEGIISTNMMATVDTISGAGMYSTLILFYLFGILAYFFIPAIGTWIVQGGETASGMSKAIAIGTSIAGAGAGFLLGSMRKASQAAWKLAKKGGQTIKDTFQKK